MNERPIIGLTLGDPAGVGPELCLRALAEPEVLRLCRPVLFGNLSVLRRVSEATGLALPKEISVICSTDADTALDGFAKMTSPVLVDCKLAVAESIEAGKVSAACGAAAYGFIEVAIREAMAGQVAAVVTAPINKEALRRAGVMHPGHTEIFTALTGAARSCMMLWSPAIVVSMATTHIGYAEVPARLSVKRLLDVIELTAEALATIHGRAARLAICGLNPHAGEHGLFGQREEERFVEPAVAAARARGIAIEGPLPPDTAFTAQQRQRFDGFVTLYHDQGHIPFKMLAFEDGVNVTLGLPIVRTSVDHGTAFDIAWKGVAKPTSLFQAIACAVRMSQSRRA